MSCSCGVKIETSRLFTCCQNLLLDVPRYFLRIHFDIPQKAAVTACEKANCGGFKIFFGGF
jgi:hypothetical protein